jgi:hypothetical protein
LSPRAACASKSFLERTFRNFVEECDSAAETLDRVRALLKAGLPNIRILDERGRLYSLTEIQELAEDERDGV